uniref:electron transfer flavoprotein subunit alpha/FixB family protein n=1 Tax=Bordetella sputigena TaxID=1416810 RepID=UPI0039EF1247
MAVLVISEHEGGSLKPVTFNTLAAAAQVGTCVDMLVGGSAPEAAARQAGGLKGVREVLHVTAACLADGLPESWALQVASVAEHYTHIFFAASSFGKNVAPRLAGLLDMAALSDVIAVISPNIFQRPIYAGNAVTTVEVLDSLKIVTVRSSAFAVPEMDGGSAGLRRIPAVEDPKLSRIVSRQAIASQRPDLVSASAVVAGGRGMGSAENFAMLDTLADKLGAAVGASRAAVDAGYASNSLQIGQTGKIVAPDVYIAVGISGAIQHLAGMKDSRVIVAINKDPEAPIFGIADYGLRADLFDAVPELSRLIDTWGTSGCPVERQGKSVWSG